MRDLVLQAVDSLDELQLPKATRVIMPLLLKALGYRRDSTRPSETIGQFRADLLAVHAALGQLEGQLLESEAAASIGRAVDQQWWQDRRAELDEAIGSDPHPDVLSFWVAVWATALAADEYIICEEVASLGERLAEPELTAALRDVAVGIRLDHTADALAQLGRIAGMVQLDDRTAVTILVLQARLQLRQSDPETAGRAASAAEKRAADALAADSATTGDRRAADPFRGSALAAWALALSVRAEVDLATNDGESARERLLRATGLSVAPPDCFVAAALLAERDRAWSFADAYCDQALSRGLDPAKSGLLRPTPSRLLVRAARTRRITDPEQALEFLDRALRNGIVGDGDYPEADVNAAKAEVLLELGREQDAAWAYADAGNRYAWSGQRIRGLDLLSKATALSPETPEMWWWYGELLRQEAVHTDATIDRHRMAAAADAVGNGMARAEPADVPGWALVVQGLIAAELPTLDLDAAALMERAILHGEREGISYYAFLTAQLRREGYIVEAFETARYGNRRHPDDLDLVDALVRLNADLGDYGSAIELVDGHRTLVAAHPTLLIMKATVLRRQQRLDEAVELLSGLDRTEWALLTMGLCYEAAGSTDKARQTYQALWDATNSAETTLSGWAAYRLGMLDEAIDRYSRPAELAPGHLSYRRDLGLMRLVRGDPGRDDLRAGAELLRSGISATTAPDELVELATQELDQVRAEVAGKPHVRAVHQILDDVRPQIDQRREHLLSNRRDPTGLGARLAAARNAVESDDPQRAIGQYRALAEEDLLAGDEAVAGIIWAAPSLLRQGDDLARRGNHREATAVWSSLTEVPLTGDSRLLPTLAARRVAAAVLAGETSAAEQAMTTVLEHDALEELTAAVMLVGSDPRDAWRLVDGLAAAARGRPRRDRLLVAEVTAELVQSLYRPLRSAVPVTSRSPLVTAIEIHLGPDHADLRSEPSLSDGIATLREHLADTMGVRIPGARLSLSTADKGDQVEFLLSEHPLAVVDLDPAAPDRGKRICEMLEAVLRPQLYRLVGPDDVGLWLGGWDAETSSVSAWRSADQHQGLRVARVLRLLLREGVPIRDRTAIFGAFTDADQVLDGAGPLAQLRAVRRRLGAEALGLRPGDQLCPLPLELERRVVDALDGDGSRWELRTDAAAALLAELRSWLARTCPPDSVVTVENPWSRVYVWRLLANQRSRLRVLADEEVPA